MTDVPVTSEEFRDEWLADILNGNPSTSELGRRFARKLITQWLDVDDASDDLVYCDGAGDGGIDIACLYRGESQDLESDGERVLEGHTWYLVQSKYGSAFRGTSTLLQEGHKVVTTLAGDQKRLSSLAEGLLELLSNFRNQASEFDHIVLVYASESPLTEGEKKVAEDVRAMGRARLGPIFDVESVSIATIYQRMLEDAGSLGSRLTVPVAANLAPSGDDLLVGSIPLLSLYEFLKSYRALTMDLDQLYEKNVRRFLGTRGRVNKAIQQTLKDEPERFGLYNNGITVVVADFHTNGDGTVELVEPYVVNGCQTTRTIWEVCHQRLEAGGTGTDPVVDSWKERLSRGVVVTKIVKVGVEGEALLRAITRYTNSQNAVREKDFLALTSDFKTWAGQMADNYGVFLEVQRGAWDSQRALQKQNPKAKQFAEAANAFDLVKVYGSGWLGEAGTAFGRNAAFVPNGSIFRRIVNNQTSEDRFGVDDLYAAYRLQAAADTYRFGRNAEKLSRRQTRFLFYAVVGELLEDVLLRATSRPTTKKDLTRALLKLFELGKESAVRSLLDAAVDLVDEYFTAGTEDSVFIEPALVNAFNNNINSYLKWEQLGKTEDTSPHLRSLISDYRKTLGRATGGQPSPRQAIAKAIMG